MDTTILLLHSYHQNPGSNRILYKYTNRPEKSFIILVVVVIVPGPKMCLSNQKKRGKCCRESFQYSYGLFKIADPNSITRQKTNSKRNGQCLNPIEETINIQKQNTLTLKSLCTPSVLISLLGISSILFRMQTKKFCKSLLISCLFHYVPLLNASFSYRNVTTQYTCTTTAL